MEAAGGSSSGWLFSSINVSDGRDPQMVVSGVNHRHLGPERGVRDNVCRRTMDGEDVHTGSFPHLPDRPRSMSSASNTVSASDAC